MKIFVGMLYSMIWSSTAIGQTHAQTNTEIRQLSAAEDLMLKGDLQGSGDLLRELLPNFEHDRLMTGLTKMAVIYLELGNPHKARIYLSELQVKLLGKRQLPHFTLKLAASYLQAGQYSAAQSTLDHLIYQIPALKGAITEDVAAIQAFIDLKQINKATRGMVKLDRKIKELENAQTMNGTTVAVTH